MESVTELLKPEKVELVEYKLRPYQETQLQFLNSHMGRGAFHLFNEDIAIESPTGSGKSVTMCRYIKEFFDKQGKDDISKVFISTGFNNLVFQLAETAKSMGINTKILIGRSHADCIRRYNKSLPDDEKIGEYNDAGRFILNHGLDIENFPVFTKDAKYRCNRDACSVCPDSKSERCAYRNLRWSLDIFNRHGKSVKENTLVITNHSTLLQHLRMFQMNFAGGFIDECHTFADFYKTFLSTDVPAYEFKALLKSAESTIANPFEGQRVMDMVKSGIKTKTLSKDTVKEFLELPVKDIDPETGDNLRVMDAHKSVCKKINDYLNEQPADNNYIHPMFEDGFFIGFKVDRFFTSVDLGLKVCLVSATVDEYTQGIFDIPPERIYIEENCKVFDYQKSSLSVFGEFNNRNLEEFINEQEGSRGLFLSTRLDLVKALKEKTDKKLCGYDLVFDIGDLVDGKKQILCGSKALFQGIDIPGIDFIILNKLPFSRLDASYKKECAYFTKTTKKNSFTKFSIPQTINSLTQAMGRLWRSPGDVGNIALFDSRFLSKFPAIRKSVKMRRPGINIRNRTVQF